MAHADPSAFERERPRLTGLAYRMLGSRAEAEDVVQDAWLRWDGAAHEAVRSPAAWLTTTVTRLAIDRLRSAKARRESYVGPWLPEPIVVDRAAAAPPIEDGLDDLSMALLLVLERLSPAERAAFLLHDVFDYDYDDIAAILTRKAAACRQLVSRARRHVRDARPRFEADAESRERLLDAFVSAVNAGDVEGLTAILAEDAVFMSDGGGKANAARNPIRGAGKIVRFLLGIAAKAPPGFERRLVRVNGEPGMVNTIDGRPHSVFSLAIAGGRITAIHAVLNPDKLARL
jgi:RNA polymerase sigma-70 factor (ECF subfamily)